MTCKDKCLSSCLGVNVMLTLIALNLILVSSCFNPVYPLASVLEKNLLLHYDFDNVHNKSVVVDGSGNGNTADLINNVLLSHTGCGLGVTFTSGYLNVTMNNERRNTSSLSSTLDITVAAWIWIGNWTRRNHPIFSNYFNSNRFQYFVLRRDGVRWHMTDRTGKKKIFQVLKKNLILEARRWHHVAVTFSNETQIGIFYVNGTAYANASRSESVKNDLPPRHDWHPIVGGALRQKERNGTMDEFYIFDKALNETDLKELMRNCTPWKMPSKYVEPTTAPTTLTQTSTKDQSTLPPKLNTTTVAPITQSTLPPRLNTTTVASTTQSTLPPRLNTTTVASTTQSTLPPRLNTTTVASTTQSTLPPRLNTTTVASTTQSSLPPRLNTTTVASTTQSSLPPRLNTTTVASTTQSSLPPRLNTTTVASTTQSSLPPRLNTTTVATTTQSTLPARLNTTTVASTTQSTLPPILSSTTVTPTTQPQNFPSYSSKPNSTSNFSELSKQVKNKARTVNSTSEGKILISELVAVVLPQKSNATDSSSEKALEITKLVEDVSLIVARRTLKVGESLQLNTTETFIFLKKPTSGFMFPSKKEKDLRKANETLTFPDEMFVTGNKTPRVIVCISYKNLHNILPRKTTIYSSFIPADVTLELNSKIIGAAVDPPLSEPLKDSIEVIVTHEPVLNKTHVCSFWNHTINQWSTKGCIVNHEKSSSTQTFCECNHLTNFALLLQSEDAPTLQPLSLEIITIIGSALSILACFLCFVMFLSFKKNDTRHYLHMNLSVAIAVAQLIMLVGLTRTKYKVLCKVTAVGLHYFYLVAFLLMLSEGVHLAILIETAFKYGEVKLPVYLIASWGLPLVIVGITLGVRFNNYGSKDACFISAEMGSVYAFVGPFVLVLLINFVILLVVLRQVIRKSSLPISNKAASNMKIVRSTIKSLVILFPVLGLTWVFGVLFFGFRGLVLEYLFGIFCSLQGFFIFLFQYVLNTENRTAFLRATKRWRTSTTSHSSSRNHSDPVQIQEKTTLNRSLTMKEPLKIPKDENCELILFRTTNEFIGDRRTVSTFT